MVVYKHHYIECRCMQLPMTESFVLLLYYWPFDLLCNTPPWCNSELAYSIAICYTKSGSCDTSAKMYRVFYIETTERNCSVPSKLLHNNWTLIYTLYSMVVFLRGAVEQGTVKGEGYSVWGYCTGYWEPKQEWDASQPFVSLPKHSCRLLYPLHCLSLEWNNNLFAMLF